MMGHPSYRPLVLVRTWSGSYVELGRLHLVLAGWAREWWARITK